MALLEAGAAQRAFACKPILPRGARIRPAAVESRPPVERLTRHQAVYLVAGQNGQHAAAPDLRR